MAEQPATYNTGQPADITQRLRDLSAFLHSDASIGDEAGDLIDALREVANEAELNREGIKHAHVALRDVRERLAMVGELLAKVSAVGVTMLFDSHRDEVLAEFSTDDLVKICALSDAARPEQVEKIYRRGLEQSGSLPELRAILDGEAGL